MKCCHKPMFKSQFGFAPIASAPPYEAPRGTQVSSSLVQTFLHSCTVHFHSLTQLILLLLTRVVLAKKKEPIMKQSVFKLQKIARKREGGRTTIQCSSEEWAEIIVLISGPKSQCPLNGFDGSAHPSIQTLALISSQWHADGVGRLRPNSRLHSFVIYTIGSAQFKL